MPGTLCDTEDSRRRGRADSPSFKWEPSASGKIQEWQECRPGEGPQCTLPTWACVLGHPIHAGCFLLEAQGP